ncbi:hypothetical protein NDU88_005954 [Pleurodeles waltl]|uniref:Uncharacterized protein n=1 Tax=Pleurodeles waltl TaxID=8319 RepID=A0AAV7NRP6_PLEWA|nr:hypothetical protein NDU88_005954 [Pleurodeles waltl]
MDAQARGFECGLVLSDRIALYAINIIFFLTEPETTGSCLMQIMCVFGETSALSMNAAKSNVFPVNGYGRPTEWEMDLSLANSGLIYLGVFGSLGPTLSWNRKQSPALAQVPITPLSRHGGGKEDGEDRGGRAEESTHRSRKEEALDCNESVGRQQTA